MDKAYFPFSRGCSYYSVDKHNKIVWGRDCVEASPPKPGGGTVGALEVRCFACKHVYQVLHHRSPSCHMLLQSSRMRVQVVLQRMPDDSLHRAKDVDHQALTCHPALQLLVPLLRQAGVRNTDPARLTEVPVAKYGLAFFYICALHCLAWWLAQHV